ncbi:hypothetical protein GCM10012290_10100 [Halolactibacillus alkaliphilus]|uniref:Transposase IS4-like domain-containing protein n=1 Tax=Halolactibacillus alkaliphilus TaxID=442899 RepID=A0A511X3C8_9BACI|nr:hypothetical protein HAL01_19060 [Halolactibacillus alkaliphilus]GGN68428.1 hypothetical protein GCM10012290_10100 [Halolactibacillus alkaliphilus]
MFNHIPSEASYSCLMTELSDSHYLEEIQECIVLAAIQEGFIVDHTVAIDSTHFNARDQAPPKEDKTKPAPKNQGRKSKEEQEKWLREKTEREAKLSLYEKKIEEQLDVPK